TITANTFVGSGASLTALNASNLTTGTVPSARVTGSYTGITAIGTVNVLTVNNNLRSVSAMSIRPGVNTGYVEITGGAGTNLESNGGYIYIFGSDNSASSGQRGLIRIVAGTPSSPTNTAGFIEFRTGGNVRQWFIDRNGDFRTEESNNIVTGGDITAGFF